MGSIFFGGLEIGKTDQNAKKQTKNRPKISKSLLTDQSLLKQTDLASLPSINMRKFFFYKKLCEMVRTKSFSRVF